MTPHDPRRRGTEEHQAGRHAGADPGVRPVEAVARFHGDHGRFLRTRAPVVASCLACAAGAASSAAAAIVAAQRRRSCFALGSIVILSFPLIASARIRRTG